MASGLSFREFARRDGCDEKIVRRKVASGHLRTLPDGTIDENLVGTAWRKGNADRVEQTARAALPLASVEPGATKAESEARKEAALANLRELEYDRESGAVVAIEDVAKAVGEEYARVRSRLIAFPARVAPRLAALKDAEPIRALLADEISRALDELAADGDDFCESALRARR